MDPFPERLDVADRPAVALRILQPADWRLEYELGRVEDVPTWTMYPADIDETVARLRAQRNVEAAKAGRGVRYVVEEDGVPLGTAGFGRSDAGFEVFYAMKPEGRGRGLVTDAVRTLAAWLTGPGRIRGLAEHPERQRPERGRGPALRLRARPRGHPRGRPPAHRLAPGGAVPASGPAAR